MSDKRKFRIDAQWDKDAEIWVATSRDVPGLVIQARTDDEVVRKLRLVIPSLADTGLDREDEFEIHFRKRGDVRMTFAAAA